MNGARVSAVVVTYNHGDEIGDCLEAVLAQDVEGGLEVMVVDNASTDDTLDVVRRYGDRGVRLLALDHNSGYAAATNAAANVTTSELLLLLNPDCIVDEGCVQRLVDHLDGTPGVGAAAAMLRYPDGRPQLFARKEPTSSVVFWDLTEVGRRLDRRLRKDRGRRDRRYADLFESSPAAPFSVDCPAAACVLLWRAPVGNTVMRADLPLFFNDADLYFRLGRKGYDVQVVPFATAVHGYGTSLQRLPDARKRAEFVVAMRVWARQWWPLRRRVVLTLLLLLDVVSAVPLAVRSRNRAVVRAHLTGTLGGLGLPGGSEPWLSSVPGLRGRFRLTRTSLREATWSTVHSLRRRSRRRRFLRRLRWAAFLSRTQVDVQIDPSAEIAPGVHLELKKGRRSTLRIGPRVIVQPGVVLRLWGGRLDLGTGVQLRHGACLTVKGSLHLSPRTTISRGVNVHCDGTMVMGFGASVAEGATIVDSRHVLGTTLPVFDLPVVQADVTIGAGAFIGANAVVNAGTSIGARAVVGACSVVTRDVPAGVAVVGSPARERERTPPR